MLARGTALQFDSRRVPVQVSIKARMTELQPVALSPLSRIRSTRFFRSESVGDSVKSHLKAHFVPRHGRWRDVYKVLLLANELLESRLHVNPPGKGSLKGGKPGK
jgi:hypothetical protein